MNDKIYVDLELKKQPNLYNFNILEPKSLYDQFKQFIGQTDNSVTLSDTVAYLSQFEGHEYGGEWSMNSMTEVQTFNPEFDQTKGKARMRFQISTFASYPENKYIEFYIRLYNGDYLNRNTEIGSHIQLLPGSLDEIHRSSEIIRIESGHLFSKPNQIDEVAKIDMIFIHNENDNTRSIKLKIETLTDNPMLLQIDFEYPYSDMTSWWSVFIYSFLLLSI